MNFRNMPVFYLPGFFSEEVILSEEESGHVVRVLRLKEGSLVWLVNGKGSLAEASVRTAHPRKCQLKIERIIPDFEKRNFSLHLAVAPTKNSDRMEWLVEKATEIGMEEFTPLLCRHSERKHLQTGRLEKVAISAMKQSVKAYLPQIHQLTAFEEFVTVPFRGRKLIAHCHPGEKPHLFTATAPGEDVLVLIGPEGDFSPEEVRLALENGFQEITLGTSRLRTETAAMAACMAVAVKNEVYV